MNGVKRYLFTWSASIYPEYLKADANLIPLAVAKLAGRPEIEIWRADALVLLHRPTASPASRS